MENPPKSFKEERIRKITSLYYSRTEIMNAIFDFSKDREICPRYFESFGKRPDSLQYPSDVFSLVKKGATSFHCSEEIWKNPLNIKTGMSEKQLNEIRQGWDLLIDIDCKWFDYAKLAAKAVIKVLENNGVKNIGVKFSGSKGFHIIVPWKSFPKEINGEETKNLFPKIPRALINYLRFYSERELKQNLPEDFFEKFKDVNIKKGIKCNHCQEIALEYELAEFFCERCKIGQQKKIILGDKTEVRCPSCGKKLDKKNSTIIYECQKCGYNSREFPNKFSKTIQTDLFELMGLDLILVSPRHLFRMPYSLHEKTALASVVIDKNQVSDFQPKDADPFKAEVKNFIPECNEGEASRLLMQVLDWNREQNLEGNNKRNIEYKPIQINDKSEKNFPPCIKKILLGIKDGKKRSVFALINFLRSIGIEKDELEKIIYSWNEKNEPKLQTGYLTSQISWALKRKPIMPPNCREFYQGIGVCVPDSICNIVKNPVNYVVRKNFTPKRKYQKNKDNFKNNN